MLGNLGFMQQAHDDFVKLVERDWAKSDAADARQANERAMERTQDFNADEAAKQRDWAAYMSGTAYRRAVSDLKEAGLNPMLAYHQGGASTPSGSAASSSPVSAQSASHTAFNRSDALIAGQQSASQIQVNTALADRIKAEAENIRAQTPTHAVNIDRMKQEIKESEERIRTMIEQAGSHAATAANLRQQTVNLQEIVPQIRAHVQQLQSLTRLQGAQLKQALAAAGLDDAKATEIVQRVKENLPALEAQLARLEVYHRQLSSPGREQEFHTQDSFVGSLGATLRALNPFSSFFGSIPSTTIINRR